MPKTPTAFPTMFPAPLPPLTVKWWIGPMLSGNGRKGVSIPCTNERLTLIDRYARKLAENINQSNLIDARVPSILIAGGSNFPVRKKEKQNAARDKNMGEYMQIEGLLDKVRSTGMGGISADDDRAVEKLEAKLAGWRPCRRK